jgi:biotin carboxylase
VKTKNAYVVFEPINHMMKVIEAAKRRGLAVIVFRTQPLTTSAPYAVGADAVDVDVVIDGWTDHDALLAQVNAACEGYTVLGSYAAAEPTIPFEAKFRQQRGLPGMTPDTVTFLLNKERVRNFLFEKGLSRLKTISHEDALKKTDWAEGEAYFFKPVNGAGSALVRKVTSLAQLQEAIAHWDAKSEVNIAWLRRFIEETNQFFLDEAAQGTLMSVEGFTVAGRYTPLGISSRTLLSRDHSIEMGICFPYRHPHEDKIVDKVRRIHEALGVTNGPTHAEVMVSDDGEVELVELNIRFIGSDGVLVINAALGARVEDQIVKVTVGEQPDIVWHPDTSGAAAFQMILPPPDMEVVESFEFPQEMIVNSRIIFPVGTKLHSTNYQNDQICSYIVRAGSYQQVLELAREVRENTRINGKLLGKNPNNVVDVY